MNKKKNKNLIIILLVILLVAISVGYAAFSQTLTINGSVTGTANWDVKFTAAEIDDALKTTISDHGTATVSTDGTTITADVKLSYPGDGCLVKATVKNAGSLDAKLTSITLNTDGTDKDDVEVSLPEAIKAGEIIKANGTCTIYIPVKWKLDSTKTKVESSFTVTYTYEQSTTESTVSPSHVDG